MEKLKEKYIYQDTNFENNWIYKSCYHKIRNRHSLVIVVR